MDIKEEQISENKDQIRKLSSEELILEKKTVKVKVKRHEGFK